MLRVACAAILTTLAVVSAQDNDLLAAVSPCPRVFSYVQRGVEEGKWYGIINLTTDIVLHGLWLNIVLDGKADVLGNWVGEVTTKDNMDFKVQNTGMKITPGAPVPVRFFVQYNSKNKAPILKAIRLNGEEICVIPRSEVPLGIPDTPSKWNSWDTTAKPTAKPTEKVTTVKTVDNKNPAVLEDKRTDTVSGTNEDKKPGVGSGTNRPAATASASHFNSKPNKNNNFYYERPHSYEKPSLPKSTTPYPYKTTSNDEILLTTSTTVRSSNFYGTYDNEDDYDDDRIGGIPTIYIPGNLEKITKKVRCGKVIFNNSCSEVADNENGSLEGQFPWQIALYQNQRSGETKYICGGTLVTHRHVITAAHCVTRRGSTKIVNVNTLTMHLGKNNLRTSVDGVQIKLVGKITVHPEYNATTFSRDIAILQLKEPVTYTDHVLPICLWPERLHDLNSVIGKHGSLVGWGIEDSGATKPEMSLVKMPVVDSDTCVKSYGAYFAAILSEYSYCATYAEGTTVCNSDSGGGMVFRSGDTWYLRGVASLSVARENHYRCDPDHYVIFTDVAKFLQWIKENTYDY